MRYSEALRFFNTTGPVRADRHYCIPPLDRLDLDTVRTLIHDERYFVLHAPRQTGKTSILLALRDLLNRGGRLRCAYVNVEVGQAAREDTARAMRAIIGELASAARRTFGDADAGTDWFGILDAFGPDGALKEVLTRWSEADPRPLMLLIDEIDALVGDTLLSVLRQLRAGYVQRPTGFPQSVVLCGVRDVRDYRIRSSAQRAVIAGGSAFNIKAESLRLGDFSPDEMRALLAQHTDETGQPFEPGALDLLWTRTQGQPWLVNALADEVCRAGGFSARSRTAADDILDTRPATVPSPVDADVGDPQRADAPDGPRRDPRPVRADDVVAAQERLILRRETHLDQLADQLREDRVRRVVGPLLSGGDEREFSARDIEYARDLGLIALDDPLRMANPVYAEIVPRELTSAAQSGLVQETSWYVDAAGNLQLDDLLAAFQTFFREHSEHWVPRFAYREAGPQLLLQAFLQRIVNGGGRIEREYGLGRGRTDLLVVWPQAATAGSSGGGGPHPVRRFVIECKVLRGSLERTVGEGAVQTASYMDRCGAAEGHLVIFDRDAERPWSEKVFRQEARADGRAITVWGM